MKVEIKISDTNISGKKISVKETFGSLEEAREWIDKCIFVKARQELKTWIMKEMQGWR